MLVTVPGVALQKGRNIMMIGRIALRMGGAPGPLAAQGLAEGREMRAQALQRTRRNFRKVVDRVGRAPEAVMSLAPMLHEAEHIIGTASSKGRLESIRVEGAPLVPVF